VGGFESGAGGLGGRGGGRASAGERELVRRFVGMHFVGGGFRGGLG
jgi:hypothetical protein